MRQQGVCSWQLTPAGHRSSCRRRSCWRTCRQMVEEGGRGPPPPRHSVAAVRQQARTFNHKPLDSLRPQLSDMRQNHKKSTHVFFSSPLQRNANLTIKTDGFIFNQSFYRKMRHKLYRTIHDTRRGKEKETRTQRVREIREVLLSRGREEPCQQKAYHGVLTRRCLLFSYLLLLQACVQRNHRVHTPQALGDPHQEPCSYVVRHFDGGS